MWNHHEARVLPVAIPVAPPELLDAPTAPVQDLDALLAPLSGREDVRVLRRLTLPCRYGDAAQGVREHLGAILDVETTGLSPDAKIIELAVLQFKFTVRGTVTEVGRPLVWREDPGEPLPPEITNLTSLTDADLVGRAFPVAEILEVLRPARLLIAHNAAFDRPRVEARFPALAEGHLWGCSLQEVDWRGRGFGSQKLDYLAAFHASSFFEGHRAGNDVEATLHILACEPPDGGRPVLRELLLNVAKPSWLVFAHRAAFELKDRLRARGYRWNADARCWWTQTRDRPTEEAWLATEIYAGTLDRPGFLEQTAADRYRA